MSNLTVVTLVLAVFVAAVLGSTINRDAASASSKNVRGGSYVTLGDKEYFISDDTEQVDYAGAVAKCEELGLTLLSIETQEENSRIVQHCSENDCLLRFIWTSAVKNGPRDWSWSATGESVIFFDWAYRQPDNVDEETAIVVYPAEGWNDANPTDVHSNYICE